MSDYLDVSISNGLLYLIDQGESTLDIDGFQRMGLHNRDGPRDGLVADQETPSEAPTASLLARVQGWRYPTGTSVRIVRLLISSESPEGSATWTVARLWLAVDSVFSVEVTCFRESGMV